MHHTDVSVVTIERFIIEQEKRHAPQATGELSGILYDLALAAKMIANKVRSAGLADILGATSDINVQGETQQKLDVLANDDHDQGARSRRASVRDGVGGGAGHHPDPRGIQDGQVLPAVRSARRLVEHRRQRAGRDDLLGAEESHAGAPGASWPDMLQRGTPPGRGRLRDLRVEHDAGVHDGPGRARLHARSVDRRVPACRTRTSGRRGGAGISRSTMPTRETGTSRCGP